VEHLGDFVVC